MPQKFLRFPPHFVVHDNSEHGLQIPIHGIASSASLKVVPCLHGSFLAVARVELLTFCLRVRHVIGSVP